jgi:hypothetical protein
MSERRSRKAIPIPQKASPEQWVNQGRERQAKADKALKRLTLDIPEDLHRALKHRALEEDKTRLELVQTWIEERLGESV